MLDIYKSIEVFGSVINGFGGTIILLGALVIIIIGSFKIIEELFSR